MVLNEENFHSLHCGNFKNVRGQRLKGKYDSLSFPHEIVLYNQH